MAAVKFISNVEQNDDGTWQIKLTDTFDNVSVICKDLDEYKVKVEDMGSEYGNDIEVIWEKDPKLTPANIQELHEKMAKLQKEYEDEIKEIENQKLEQENNDLGFNPNG